MEEVRGAKSVIRRTATRCSLILVDSDRSAPTHNHPFAMARGLKVSNKTVFPTPLSPIPFV
jgi:hypothetical protein